MATINFTASKKAFVPLQVVRRKVILNFVGGAIFLLLTFVCFPVLADDKKLSPAPILTISPKRCMLKADQDVCRINLILSWQANESLSICLTEKGDELALACWDNAIRGATRLLFVGDKSTTYVLSSEETKNISEVIFSIGRVSKKKRKSNNRRRRFWGFL